MDLKPEFRVVIAGSRSFKDLGLMRAKCDSILTSKALTHMVVIISGTAGGADRLGEEYGQERGFEVRRFPADWERYKKRAGIIRNQQMLDVADAVIVFWNGISPGSENMASIADAKGAPLRVIRFQA